MIKPLINRRGATALEFAVVLPLFLTLALGMLHVSNIFFSSNALQYAVQEAARCASVDTVECPNIAKAKAYAQKSYVGSGTPSFTHSIQACGNSISASLTYSWSIGLHSFTTPLSASACFPSS